jgi:hypothetical protein
LGRVAVGGDRLDPIAAIPRFSRSTVLVPTEPVAPSNETTRADAFGSLRAWE